MTLLITLAVLCSIILILIVLVQNPKGSGLNSTIGGAQQYTQFLGGAANAGNVLERATFVLAAVILVACLITSILN